MSETKTKYTVSEALKCLKGISKKRIYEMMNSSDISYTDEEYGSSTRRIIDGSELTRVFNEKFYPNGYTETKKETVSETSEKPNETSENAVENKLLKKEVEILKQQLLGKQEVLREVERARDKAEELVEDLSKKLDKSFEERTFLLEDHRNREGELKKTLEDAKNQLAETQQPVEAPRRFLGIFPRKTA